MKKLKMPQAFTILIILTAVMALLTWIVPAGEYEKILTDSGSEPVAGTYSETARSGRGVSAVLQAPFSGFYDAVDIAVFILMVGSFLGVMNMTGALEGRQIPRAPHHERAREMDDPYNDDALCARRHYVRHVRRNYRILRAHTSYIYSRLGDDAVTAVAVIMLGAGTGVLGSTVNPFATGIASGFAGISTGDGMILRLAIFIVGLVITVIYVMRYAELVRKDPARSLVADMRESNLKHFASPHDSAPALTGRRKAALALFAVTFIIMIYGVIPFDDMGISVLPSLGWWDSRSSPRCS